MTRENIMDAIDKAKFITIARESLGGHIPQKDPFIKDPVVSAVKNAAKGKAALKTGKTAVKSYKTCSRAIKGSIKHN